MEVGDIVLSLVLVDEEATNDLETVALDSTSRCVPTMGKLFKRHAGLFLNGFVSNRN